MNDKASVLVITGGVKNSSWLFWSVRPNRLSWQQDRIWHHSLWFRMKEMDSAGFENHHRNGSLDKLVCHLRSYWLEFLDLRKRAGSGEQNKKKKWVVRLSGPSPWVGWFYGQCCTVLQSSVKRQKEKKLIHVFRQDNSKYLHTHKPFVDMEYLSFVFTNIYHFYAEMRNRFIDLKLERKTIFITDQSCQWFLKWKTENLCIQLFKNCEDFLFYIIKLF